MNDAIFDGHTVGASRHGRDAEGRALATMLCATHREEPLYLARTIGLKNCVFFENEAPWIDFCEGFLHVEPILQVWFLETVSSGWIRIRHWLASAVVKGSTCLKAF